MEGCTRRLRTLLGLGIACAVAALVPRIQAQDIRAEDPPLAVVSYGGLYQKAQQQVFFAPFRKASGIAVTDHAWDGGMAVLRDRVQNGMPRWDVVQVDDDELARGCEEGLFVDLDWARIGGRERYLTEAVSRCGVGAILYSLVLAYNRSSLASAPAGWANFFDTNGFPGKRALRLGPKTTLEIALLGDGVAAADIYTVLATPKGVDRAFSKLDTIKADLVFWHDARQPARFLAEGKVVMSSAYNGRIEHANRSEGTSLGTAWTGALDAVDWWVILKGSPRETEAYRFLEFVGRADNQAQLPDLITYGVPSRDANELIDPQRRSDLPSAPDNMKNALMISADFWRHNLNALTERFNKWAVMK